MNREAALTKMTKGQPVRELANSPFLYMPLSAYRGHFARPVVREGTWTQLRETPDWSQYE